MPNRSTIGVEIMEYASANTDRGMEMEPAPKRKLDWSVTRDEGIALTLVGVLIGVGAVYLFTTSGPSTNAARVGEICGLVSGVLFVIGIIVLAIAKPRAPKTPAEERLPP